MKQFYVDTQGIPELWNLLQEKAKEAGYSIPLEFRKETEQSHPFILFNKPYHYGYLRLTVKPSEQEFTIPQALTYFRELKEEREKIFIGGYEVKFHKENISVDSETFSFSRVREIGDIMERSEIKALIFHGCNGKEIKVDFETVNKIAKRLK